MVSWCNQTGGFPSSSGHFSLPVVCRRLLLKASYIGILCVCFRLACVLVVNLFVGIQYRVAVTC